MTDPGGFTDALAAFASEQEEPPVLFYEGDWDVLAISRDRERLGRLSRFTLPDAELVEDLMDKARFQRLARRLDLPVPRRPRRGRPPTRRPTSTSRFRWSSSR